MDKLVRKTEKEKEATGLLLEPHERFLWKQIAAGQSPYNRRAQALLALDEGATPTATAEQSGQTAGQVRYWLNKFRKRRMGAFPEEFLPQPEPEMLSSQPSLDQPTVPEATDLDQPVDQDTVEEKSGGAAEKVEPVKKGRAKKKKKSKKAKASRKATKK